MVDSSNHETATVDRQVLELRDKYKELSVEIEVFVYDVRSNTVFRQSQISSAQLEQFLSEEPCGQKPAPFQEGHLVTVDEVMKKLGPVHSPLSLDILKALLDSFLSKETLLQNKSNKLLTEVGKLKKTTKLKHIRHLLPHQNHHSNDDVIQPTVSLTLREYWANASLSSFEELLNELHLQLLYNHIALARVEVNSDLNHIIVSWAVPDIDTSKLAHHPPQPQSFVKAIGIVSLDIEGVRIYETGTESQSVAADTGPPLSLAQAPAENASTTSTEVALHFIMELMKCNKATGLLMRTKCIQEMKLPSYTNTPVETNNELSDPICIIDCLEQFRQESNDQDHDDPVSMKDEKYGGTLLHWAALWGWLELVKVLVTEYSLNPMEKDNDGKTPLVYACWNGKLDIVKYLITECNCDPVCRDDKGGTLLHKACYNGWLSIVQYLITECECDPMQTDVKGFNSLYLACYGDQYDIVRYLITECKCDPMQMTHNGLTLLHYACSYSNVNIIRFLITECEFDPNCKANNAVTPLHKACSKSRLDVLQYLIGECRCDPMDRSKNGLTLLHYACSVGEIEIVRYLVEQCKCDPMSKANNGGTPLHEACNNGKLDVVQYLIETCECDPMVRTNDLFTPLHFACYSGQLDVVKLLIEKYQCNTVCMDKNGTTPLYNACSTNGSLSVVQYLIDKCKCDPMCRVKGGFTPLHYACYNGQLDIVQYLTTDCHCDPMSRDDNGRSTLHEACFYGKLDIVQYLISKCKCDAMCRDNKGETPLHEACISGELSLVRCLIEDYKCDPNKCRASSGKTPLHHACSNGKLDVVQYLVLECKCDPMLKTPLSRMSSLSAAALNNHYDVVVFLLANGCSLASYEIGLLPTTGTNLKSVLRLASKCYAVNSFVSVFLLGESGVGKSTLTEVIKHRVSSGKQILLGKYRTVSQAKPLTAGIVPHVLNHKELGNVILHDLAGQPQFYSSHSAILEDMLSGSPVVFILVTKLSDPPPYKWLSTIKDLSSKCSSHCALLTIASHADLVKKKTEKIRYVKRLEREILSSIDEYVKVNFGVYYLNCHKLVSKQLNLFLDSLLSACQTLRDSQVAPSKQAVEDTAKYKMYISMLFLLMKSKKKDVYSVEEFSELVELSKDYYLPSTKDALLDSLRYLHTIGLILFIESARGSWVVSDKETLLNKVIGTLLAPEDFSNYQTSLASNTGIVAENQLERLFREHNPKMIVEFLIQMQLCERVTPEMIEQTNLTPLQEHYQDDMKLLFIPALLTSKKRPTLPNKQPLKFGWCLSSIEQDSPPQYFTPRFLHVLILHLAYKYSYSRVNPIERRCTIWSTGIQWENNNGVTTLVELINNDQCVVVLMSCKEGLDEYMIPARKAVLMDILSIQQKHCHSLKPKEFIINPSQLCYPIEDLSSLTLYDIDIIASSVCNRNPCVTSFTSPHVVMKMTELFPVEHGRGRNMSVFMDRDPQMLSVDVHVLPPIPKSPVDVLTKYMAQLSDLLVNDSERLGNNLLSKGLISFLENDDILTTTGISGYDKVSMLIKEVLRKMAAGAGNDMEMFKTFCEILKQDFGFAMERIVSKMEDEVDSHNYTIDMPTSL